AFLVSCQLVAIETVVTLAADDLCVTLIQLHADRARTVLLVRKRKGHQVLVELAEPEAVVDQVRVGLTHVRFEAQRLLGKREEIQLAVSLVQQYGGRGLVDLARLDADQAILNVVDSPDAMLARKLVEGGN